MSNSDKDQMKIFVTGARGQLGHDIMLELEKRGMAAIGVDKEEMDITDREAVLKYIKEAAPTALIHCAAWTAVDAAEDQEEACRLVNAVGTGYIAEACKDLGIPMMYFSTDYVFNGQGQRPWQPDDEPEPLGAYGRTKYEGELRLREQIPDSFFILRIQWIYGINGKNFVKTMLRLSEDHNSLRVVDDQIGSPTYTPDVARLAVDMIQTDRYGIYHVANTGYCSWYDFAVKIFELCEKNVKVQPVSTEEYGAKAVRPQNSRMDTSKIVKNGFCALPSWEDALSRFLEEIDYGKILRN